MATGQVPDSGAGLSPAERNNATVLVAANLNASNAVTKNGQKRYRVKITLQRIKGVWLVTNFDRGGLMMSMPPDAGDSALAGVRLVALRVLR